MADKKYLEKALHLLIQDLVEIWFPEKNTRVLSNINDGVFQKMEKKIFQTTDGSITSRTIRNYIKGQITDRNYHVDLLAASWFVAKGIKKSVKGETENKFNEYIELFRSRKTELNKYLGKPEDINHEFQDKLPSAADIAELISAFANKDGGSIIIGVGRDDSTINGLESDKPAITYTEAALRYSIDQNTKIEHGWGYILKDDKTFYVIKVFKSDSSELIRAAEGKTYIRNGAGNSLVDKSLTEKCILEYATKSRFNFVESLRSLKTILENFIDYNDNFKTRRTSRQEMETLCKMSISFLKEVFATYLADISKEVFFKLFPPQNLLLFNPGDKIVDDNILLLHKGEVGVFLEGIKLIPEIHQVLLSKTEILNKLFLNKRESKSEKPTLNKTIQVITTLSLLTKEVDYVSNLKYKLFQSEVNVWI